MVVTADVRVWEVVGGADKGGVLVRTGRDMSATKEEARLSTGALVEEIGLEDKRLHYKLLEGSGPKRGWVSVEISNKALLVRSSKEVDPTQLDVEDDLSLVDNRDDHIEQTYAARVPEARRWSTPWTGEPEVGARALPATSGKSEKACWTLEEVLNAADEAEAASRGKPKWAKAAPAGRQVADKLFRGRRDLVPTFGYPGSFDERPPYARFDTRDQACLRVGGFKHGQVVGDADGNEFVAVGVKCMDGVPRLFFQPTALGRAGAGAFPVSANELQLMLYPVAGENSRRRLQHATLKDFDDVEDSDEEVVTLCRQCRLPLGNFVYVENDGQGERHGECMARFMLQKMQAEEEARQEGEQARKTTARKKHDIGWRADRVPHNSDHMRSLGYHRSPQNMCCLVLDEQEDVETTVNVSETLEPAGSVNLEYLSIALRCRLREGAEPAFSLDPTNTSDDPGQTMQQKRFEPAWLAGTSVGDVLFQSDYLLKELSMGEYDQPVVGMKSCFDFSEEEGHKTEWRAREWFVVKNAGLSMSEDNVLIPQLQMGVEAREQVLGADGLEDKPLTRPDHPLVRYAQEFTENFDLIAERRSVVHHLRELAKASLIAKFLLESKVELDEPWFDLAEETSSDCCMEIPQLWNERSLAQIRVREGRIVDSEKLRCPEHHGVYGGVKFGLDRFRLGGTVTSKPGLRSSPAAAVRAAMPTLSMSDVRSMGMLVASMQGKGVAPPSGEEAVVEAVPGAVAGARPSMAMVPGMAMRGAAPMGPAPVRPAPSAGALARQMQGMLVSKPGLDGRRARLDVPSLHGVDLNLDQFNLDEPVRVASLVAASGWGEDAVMSKAFWSELENDSSSIFSVNDKALFREVFNPSLSDRREEGEQFAPPDPSFEYIERLRCLVEQEREVRRQRKEHFLSSKFMANNPGPLFPSAWLDSFEISREAGLAALPQGSQLQPRPDYQAQAAMFEHALKEASPVFDRSTEDGLCFRVYKFGSLEVRTTQERDGSEVIGAVFSIKRATDATGARQRVQENEKVTKVAEYVESYKDAADEVSRRSYVVLETEEGNVIVTEKRADGTISWEENPDDLEDRNSLAKFIRSCGCSPTKKALVTVKDMETFKKEKGTSFGTSTSGCKHYAQAAFNHARGCIGRIDSGFGSKGSWHKDKAAKDVKKETRKETRRSDMLARRAAAKQAAAVKSARSSTGRKVIDPIIVGTWDDWKYGEPMVFDEQSSSYIVELEVGPEGRESFQVLCDGDWDLCLHPDEDDASPRNALCGPDSDGHGKNWTIGSTEEAPEGSVFRVVLRVSASGCAEKVEWERMA
mmetsp:Transcript_80881/g.237743  ORF Transcript_80881/g.237743 Transcript_80881/m.237743 type:complete len:1312 (+) Transcript_80881:71-4006(+)